MKLQTLRLASGRKLSYRSFGNPQGEGLIFFHGFPGSSIQGQALGNSKYAERFNILAFDRPGFAESDLQPQRSLSDMATDLKEVLDQLGLSKVHVFGVSGGSPYAISVATLLADRVKTLTLVCPLGPLYEKSLFAEFPVKAKMLLTLGSKAPKLTGFILKKVLPVGKNGQAKEGSEFESHKNLKIQANKTKDKTSVVETFAAALPSCDLQVMQDEKIQPVLDISLKEALQQGVEGPLSDIKVFMSDWKLDLNKLQIPVHIFHGTEDTIIPLASAQNIHGKISQSKFHLIEGEGHYSLPIRRIDQILATI